VLTVSLPGAADLYGYQFELRYDPAKFRYAGGLESAIPEISSIFASSFEGRLLVGATMIGERGGVGLGGSPACRLRMVALADGEAGGFELGGVHTVDGSLGYRENEAGWTLSASKQ
jgi:hypothetical protein